MDSFISIIIPCYNVANYLDDCFISLTHLAYKDFEVIFVDDGSKDDTGKKLDDFALTFSKAKIIHQVNAGVSSARNAAIKIARGNYLYFCDPDDFIHPQTLDLLYGVIKKENSDIVFFDYKKFKQEKRYVDYHFSSLSLNRLKLATSRGKNEAMVAYLRHITHSACMGLFKTNIIKKISHYPDVFDKNCTIGEDGLFCAKCVAIANSITYLNAKLYYWRQRSGSALHSQFSEKDMSGYFLGNFLKQLDHETYPNLTKYINVSVCLISMSLINKIRYTKTIDSRLAKLVYQNYRNNVRYAKSCRIPFQYRFGLMFTRPVMYGIMKNKIK